MYEGFDLWTFLLGLPLAIVISFIIFYFSWRKGKRTRQFDERYERIQQHGKSISWKVTTIAILIAWAMIIIVEGPNLAFFIMTGIWIAHMLSYLIAVYFIEKNH